MKANVPAKVIVKITVNQNLADDLREAGFTAYKRTISQQAEIDARHTSAAEERGVDPMRFAQTLAHPHTGEIVVAGRAKPDSGTPVFGRNGQTNVSLIQVAADIARELPNLKLVGVNMQTKPDGKSVVWQVYEPATSEKPEIVPAGGIKFHLGELNETIYGHLHVWRNPDDSLTVNAGSPMRDNVRDPKVLRILEHGCSIRCVAR